MNLPTLGKEDIVAESGIVPLDRRTGEDISSHGRSAFSTDGHEEEEQEGFPEHVARVRARSTDQGLTGHGPCTWCLRGGGSVRAGLVLTRLTAHPPKFHSKELLKRQQEMFSQLGFLRRYRHLCPISWRISA